MNRGVRADMSFSDSPRRPRRTSARIRRRRFFAVLIAALVVIGGTAAVITAVALTKTTDAAAAPSPSASSSPRSTPTPTPTPLTPSEQLLATTDDQNACAVGFQGDGISDAPQLQHQGTLYDALPIP